MLDNYQDQLISTFFWSRNKNKNITRHSLVCILQTYAPYVRNKYNGEYAYQSAAKAGLLQKGKWVRSQWWSWHTVITDQGTIPPYLNRVGRVAC